MNYLYFFGAVPSSHTEFKHVISAARWDFRLIEQTFVDDVGVEVVDTRVIEGCPCRKE